MRFGVLMCIKSSYLRQPILSKISRRLKLNLLLKHLQPGARILEVGAGQGWFANQLKAFGYKVTRLDLVNKEADITGDINDWEQLGVQKHAYDAVIALEVIEHVDCLTSLSTICKIDGQRFPGAAKESDGPCLFWFFRIFRESRAARWR